MMASHSDLQKHNKELEERLDLAVRKKSELSRELILYEGTDPAMVFRLKEEIAKLEILISKIKRELEKEMGLPTSSENSILRELLADMNLHDEITLGDRVNCDRKKVHNKFWQAFNNLNSDPFQFFLLPACPTQMPPSFAERMVYELIDQELSDNDQAILFRRKEDNRVKIQKLPLGYNLPTNKKRFMKSISKLFDLGDAGSFDHFLNHGLIKMRYDFAVLPYYIHEAQSPDHLLDFLEWLMETFSRPRQLGPRLLFIVVLYIQDLHLKMEGGSISGKRPGLFQRLLGLDPGPDQLQLFRQLEGLCQRHQAASFLHPFEPVKKVDLDAWLLDRGETDPGKWDTLVHTFVKTLPYKEQEEFRKNRTLNMDDVERLQAIICDYIDQT